MNKKFYIGCMFGEDDIAWPTSNFTNNELDVIERFLSELNEHIDGKCVDCIAVLEDDGEEEW